MLTKRIALAVLLGGLLAAGAATADDKARADAAIAAAKAAQKAADPLELQAARVYARYVESLKAYNGLDFDDLITAPVTLLRDDAEVRGQWQARLGYLLVDEYQDTNRAHVQKTCAWAQDERKRTLGRSVSPLLGSKGDYTPAAKIVQVQDLQPRA